MLEIGSYESRSAIFFLKNFSDSNISCVDTWSGSDEHSGVNFELIEKNFDLNTSFYQSNNMLRKYKMTSNEFFKKNDKHFEYFKINCLASSNNSKNLIIILFYLKHYF